MIYTVIFYAVQPGRKEKVVAVQRIQRTALTAYTGAPAIVLGAARAARKSAHVSGFRIMDVKERVVLDYADVPPIGGAIVAPRHCPTP